MSTLKLVNINKVYDNGVQAVFNFNLDIADKEFVVFVGPSGCGKSTTLRMIAGLEEITEGELYINDKLMNEVHPKDRNIGMVFQSYALYPHMSVYENMAYGLKIQRLDKEEIERRIDHAVSILGLRPYLKRKPKELSGGQRQRVALGRAIVREPKVFLMDEPLSNLDAKLRVQMRAEIIKIHQKIGATTIYVTHDQTEAMTMADRIVVMKDGYIQQIGTPSDVYNKPMNMFVAGFIGSPSMNFIKATYLKGKIIFGDDYSIVLSKAAIKQHDEFYKKLVEEYEAKLSNRLEEIEAYNNEPKTKNKIVPEEDDVVKGFKDKIAKVEELLKTDTHDVVFGIRPEDVYLEDDPSKENPSTSITLKCDMSELLGHERIVYTDLNDKERIVIKVNAKWDIKSGDDNKYVFNLERLNIFDPITTRNILCYYPEDK